MQKLKLITLIFVLATVPVLGIVAQVRLDSCEFVVHFKVGSAAIDSHFANNAKALAALDTLLSGIIRDGDQQRVRITVKGSSSPDGGRARNLQLGRQRRDAFAQYVRSKYELLAETVVIGTYGIAGEGQAQRLTANDLTEMRNASSTVVVTRIEEQKEEKQPSVVPAAVIQPAKEPTQPEPTDTQETVAQNVTVEAPTLKPDALPILLRTNLLYDAALVPNVGLEVYLGRGLSVGANWMYAWWSKDAKARYWRIYGGDVALRYYFAGRTAGATPFRGHHLGVYGQMLTYDFELGHRGYLGDKWTWGAGVEYGYSLPLKKRLSIDFSVGIGYLGGEYKKYTPSEGHYYRDATKQLHYVGPTNAQVSLVWLIGRGNVNRKGGEQ